MSNDVHIAKVSKIAEIAYPISRQQQQKQQKACSNIEQSGGTTVISGRPPESPDPPDYTQITNESDNNISSCSTLDIKMVENIAQQQLETQVRELTKLLQKAEEDKKASQLQLKECQAEKELCLRRVEVAHECRITEMHCVIAELSKKLRTKQEHTIVEEQEPDEISFQEGSIYNSELNLTNPDAECQTDPLESLEGYSADDGVDGRGGDHSCSGGGDGIGNGNYGLDISDLDIKCINENNHKGQVEALQEEVLHLKAHVALLQSEIANSLHMQNDSALDFKAEQNLKNKIDEAEGHLSEEQLSDCSSERLHFVQTGIEHGHAVVVRNRAIHDADISNSPLEAVNICMNAELGANQNHNVPKMAERIKLHCVSKNNTDNVSVNEFFHNQMTTANIVEHLVSDLKQNTSVLESFVEPTQLDNELQRLHRRIEHLKMQNTVLTLTLDECKEHCEHLYLLCGKYESNAIALQLAVNCSDRAIEAYDVMLALLETKLSILKDENSIAAEESRKAVESVARHLLDRLDNEKDLCENSFGPWQNNFSIPDRVSHVQWTDDDDARLRNHVSKLKGRRSTVQNTIVNLESPFSDFYEKSRITAFESGSELKNQERNAHLDLEMAVLTQELHNLREENMNLKLRTAELERERQYETDRVNILQEALNQLHNGAMDNVAHSAARNSLFIHSQNQQLTSTKINDNCCDTYENRISFTEADHSALIEQQLVEALNRESELKSRIQKLVASIAATQKSTPVSSSLTEKIDQRHRAADGDLQKTALNMTHLLEQNIKRKYQARIRRLEQKIIDMTLKSSTDEANELLFHEGITVIADKAHVEKRRGQRFLRSNINPDVNQILQTTTSTLLQENVPETTL